VVADPVVSPLKALLGLPAAQPIGTTSSSPYSGSPTFDEVPLHVAGQTPPLNAFAIVDSGSDDYVHYGRIIHGQEENPRADPTRLQQNRAYAVGGRDPRPGDRAPHVTRIITVQIMGEIYVETGLLAIRDPGELPQTGRPVYLLDAGMIPVLLNLPTSPDDGLDLGTCEAGGSAVTLRLPVEALARHLTIVGKTGVGKSHAAAVLIEECVRLGIPVFAFDVLKDLINATETLGGRNYQAGARDFRIPYSIIGLTEFLAFIPNLTRDQQEIVAAAYDAVYAEALRELEDAGGISVDVQRLMDEITAVGSAAGQDAVAARAARRVTAFLSRSTLLTTTTQDWLNELRAKPMINVFVGHLPQRQRNLVVAATARMLQILRRRDKVPPFELVLDEAHLFLPSDHTESPSTSVVREMVQTARHDGIGITLLTQSPSSMDRRAFVTCNTRLVFALDPEDMRLVAGHLGDLPQAVIDRIPRMRRGRCILSSAMDVLRHSVQLDVRQRETPGGAPTPNLAKEAKTWRATMMS